MTKNTPHIESFARIKVVGVGGSGKGAINHMISSNLKGVDFIAMNTDTQDLHNCLANKKIHIGKNLTKGLGAGMDPEIGKRSAEETKEEIQDALKGADMVFITGGMGGGTATGAAPVIAKVAKSEGILTVGIVTKPFFFEGQKRMYVAESGINELEKEVDALIVIPNDRLLSVIDKNTSVKDAFKMVDEVLRLAVDGISDIIKTSGTINLDFADIKRVLKDSGTALMGVGVGSGETRAVDAAKAAISSPLLDVSIHGAKGLLYAIYGNTDLSMFEVSEAAKIITESVDKDATVIFGIVHDERMKKDEVKVVVIATKFPSNFKVQEMEYKSESVIQPNRIENKIEKDNTSLKDALTGMMKNNNRKVVIKNKEEDFTENIETEEDIDEDNLLDLKSNKPGKINNEVEESKKPITKPKPITEEDEEDED
jgi:cell division protein FtsZ